MKYNRRWMAGAAKADSKWEGKIRDTILPDFNFQGEKVPYNTPHTYTPDFTFGNILIESKGRFRDSTEARKYKYVRENLDGKELIFLFYKADSPMPHSKVRKDGTKMTHGEWAEKNNFRYFEVDKDCTITKELKEFLEKLRNDS